MSELRIDDEQAQTTRAPSVTNGGRLLVMSNRAPIRLINERGHERIEATVGGVGSSFLKLLETYGGLWIAWSGGKKTPGRLLMPPANPRFAMVFPHLSERDISNYYYGMCNGALWPLMHYMTLNCSFDTAQWNSYCHVNRLFAKTAEAEASDYDFVWVQDFHLALVPSLLRERNPRLPIGLFWHVPWPPEQVFRVFPWRSQLLAGMLGSGLIGFHTATYVKHFIDSCERILKLDVDRTSGIIHHAAGITRVGSFPLGIPNDYFHDLANSPVVKARARRIRSGLRTPIVVLGVDRLDYTKGIAERILGFQRFLELHPSYRKRVTLVVVAVPSRTKVAEYAALKKQIDELVGRVIGRFSSDGWVPIRYLYTQFPPEELTAYYQAADIALITPLRDGMNLVAKEFIAAQTDDTKILILSEFAGAAQELHSALLVNPYDIDQIAEGLRIAVEMSTDEKRKRFSAMLAKVRQNNLTVWSESFLSTLLKGNSIGTSIPLSPN